MIRRIAPLFLLLLPFFLLAQSPLGAWERVAPNEEGRKIRTVVIFAGGYQAATWADAETGAFIKTNGGKWRMEGDTMVETVEFDTEDPARVGSEIRFPVWIKKKKMGITGTDRVLRRLDDGSPGDLAGAWLFAGRMRDGEMRRRPPGDQARKTMKILSGTRFQWIAYNTATGEFFGTGGGNYTTENGKYTENIGFFSRDDDRVGASLEFDFELKEGEWHHSGKSSKGEPMYEIWARRE